MNELNIKIHPPLGGQAATRFLALTKEIEKWQKLRISDELNQICENEIQWIKNNQCLNGSQISYEAAARVLIDLARLSWKIQLNGYNITLDSPTTRQFRSKNLFDTASYKMSVRNELKPLCEAQFQNKSVINFIQRLEQPKNGSKTKSIFNLIADGRELYNRLEPALGVTGESRIEFLKEAVQPYLQLVPTESEQQVKDEFTGISLGEIWRYFRYSWSIPQLSIPGRQLLYLIRDAAHPNHAIMGIAALNNSAMQVKYRDSYIGWNLEAYCGRVRSVLNSDNSSSKLEILFNNLENDISIALGSIEPSGLVSSVDIEHPTLEIISNLQRTSEIFAKLRQEALKGNIPLDSDNSQFYYFEGQKIEKPPVNQDFLDLDFKTPSNKILFESRKLLIAKKRAAELGRLIYARYYLRHYRDSFIYSSKTLEILDNNEFQTAIKIALSANKSVKIGANILELTTCGAVRPYNQILGGKLVALLMLSPEVNADYRRRYGADPSIISSQMKNSPVWRDNSLVYIGTTSLYAIGSSQYERLRLPAKIIAENQPEIRYNYIGLTSGYGTLQFSPETVRAVVKLLETKDGYQNVNSIFGEGPSPRLRKMSAGLQELGFDPELLLRHNQQRLIYAAGLCNQTFGYLRGESVILPEYITHPEKYRDATSRISSFWRSRWLASRLNHDPTMKTLALTKSWALSEELPILKSEKIESMRSSSNMPTTESNSFGAAREEVDFWRELSIAGKNVNSDEFDELSFERLHVIRPLEEFILNKVREGYSIVLTGNAGDGKTHILKKLEPELTRLHAVVQPDATAAMRRGEVTPILNEWKKALSENKSYCIAANEYPLYELRLKGRDIIPQINEVDRQCKNRLAYGDDPIEEDTKDKVLVIDLSLRNPLNHDFLNALLSRLLSNPALIEFANSNFDPNLTNNFNHLSNPIVRDRLYKLFNRIALRGERSSVRELWIILARLLFGNRPPSSASVHSPLYWYSEYLFERDDRFDLSKLLRQYADPANYSHPQWDIKLENPGSTNPDDWIINNHEPVYSLGNDPRRFDAMKRIFYFEHNHGEDAFKLEEDAAVEFHKLLNAAKMPDDTFKREIIGAINLCYTPYFNGYQDSLYLWIGHRYHEVRTRSYIANQSISSSQFDVLLPRLPRRISNALDYEPDHFLLKCEIKGKVANLRVDYSLFNTLVKLQHGLPRQLVPDRDINRLDVYLEKLKAMNVPTRREFILFNSEWRFVSKIHVSQDLHKYLRLDPIRSVTRSD